MQSLPSDQEDQEAENRDPALIESRGYEVSDYRPLTATPTPRLDRLVHLRSINPLFGVYVADQLAIADPDERIATLESVLEVPGTVARFTRMPKLEDMPAGNAGDDAVGSATLATWFGDRRGIGSKK